MSKFHLPSVVDIDTAIQYLNLDSMPYIQALKIILAYSKEGLSLNFNSKVWALDSDILIGDLFEYEEREFNGEIHQTVMNHEFVTETPDLYDQGQIIERASISGKPDNPKIYVSSFSIKGKSYNIVNYGGSKYSDISLPISSISIHRDDLVAFVDRVTAPNKLIKKTKQSEREDAVKEFLQYKSTLEGFDFQQMYIAIDSPTQAVLWSMLNAHSPDLFKAGKSDFFKNQSIINFKVGTGAGRD